MTRLKKQDTCWVANSMRIHLLTRWLYIVVFLFSVSCKPKLIRKESFEKEDKVFRDMVFEDSLLSPKNLLWVRADTLNKFFANYQKIAPFAYDIDIEGNTMTVRISGKSNIERFHIELLGVKESSLPNASLFHIYDFKNMETYFEGSVASDSVFNWQLPPKEPMTQEEEIKYVRIIAEVLVRLKGHIDNSGI